MLLIILETMKLDEALTFDDVLIRPDTFNFTKR